MLGTQFEYLFGEWYIVGVLIWCKVHSLGTYLVLGTQFGYLFGIRYIVWVLIWC